ncbi:LOW QUALITY PROTEIN: fibulin-1 [Myotis lucifugus]|uniref:LOW QUALITY PROTEIN: fibulin-1 n=1 Tax=Myotis lucifugus TaxID=59463 RepID=UPI0003C4A880|nr:LOW QUALITY PROTEIN: fibulin-1 [Myotis lucifugus]
MLTASRMFWKLPPEEWRRTPLTATGTCALAKNMSTSLPLATTVSSLNHERRHFAKASLTWKKVCVSRSRGGKWYLNPRADLSMEACCADGHRVATQHRDCSLPYASRSMECRMVQEQCCHSQLEELHCATGINLANEQDSCAVSAANASLEAVFVKSSDLGPPHGLILLAHLQRPFPSESRRSSREAEEEQEDPYPNDRCRGGGPCKQQCRDTGEEVVCSCFVGYQLLADGVSCEDVNECITRTHSCRLGESCINTVGSFRCQRDSSCGTGYELTEDNDCKDIDECESGIHNCLPDFICQNTLGSFRCRPKLQCKSGFIQDALGSCIDINECLSISPTCPVGHTCINTEGSYTCQKNVPNCGRGYHLNEEGTRCVDVDECAPPSEPCGPGHLCVNSPGSFRCECKAGFYFDGISRTCVDINECRRYSGRLCSHKCENTLGSFHCSCSAGFRLAPDGRSCEDVNECTSSPCSQECANVYGSFQCYCRRGFQLSDVDGVTCEDIDECALPTGGHICSYRCINFPGSFQCSCPPTGYRLAPNGRNCQDIDECVTGIHNCSINETCFNIQGSFRCLAFECPENYRRSADTLHQEKTDTVRCIKSCRPSDISCMRDLVHTVSHTVVSLPTFREFAHPEEIIFLRAVMPAHPANHADIIFDITEGNLRDSFDIVKRYVDGMTVGVVRQVRPIVGPFHAVLKLEMNYVVGGVVNHRNIVNVHIFVSEYWF